MNSIQTARYVGLRTISNFRERERERERACKRERKIMREPAGDMHAPTSAFRRIANPSSNTKSPSRAFS